MPDEYELTGSRRTLRARKYAGSALWYKCGGHRDMVAMCLVVSVLAARHVNSQ